MTKRLAIVILFITTLFAILTLRAEPIIIDHNCINLDEIPAVYVEKAKQDIRILYGHTSHGSQITTGIYLLRSLPESIFQYNKGDGTLSYKENIPGDLGNPNRTAWATVTRERLDGEAKDRNMIIWSWCGQVSSATEEDINTYLTLMDELERDYPDVTFVYMTGHLDGTGEEGNLNQRNEQIREFCRKNNKILFDFADIESYDPDGNYFLDKRANDGCYYFDSQNNRRNWADEWCQRNPGKCESCNCAHSKCLNCQMKGIAFWWMLARVAGWEGPGMTDVKTENNSEESGIRISPNPANNFINIYTDIPASGHMQYEIYDISGLKMQYGQLGYFNKGFYPATVDISNLPEGVYFVKLAVGNFWKMISFVKSDD